jgi:hypothetical protein
VLVCMAQLMLEPQVHFVLQVYRAKERLDQDFREKGIDVDAAEEAARAATEAAEAASQQPGRQQ